MKNKSRKSDLGAEKKEERVKVGQVRSALKGKNVNALNGNQKDELLLLLCLALGLVDKNGVIK